MRKFKGITKKLSVLIVIICAFLFAGCFIVLLIDYLPQMTESVISSISIMSEHHALLPVAIVAAFVAIVFLFIHNRIGDVADPELESARILLQQATEQLQEYATLMESAKDEMVKLKQENEKLKVDSEGDKS